MIGRINNDWTPAGWQVPPFNPTNDLRRPGVEASAPHQFSGLGGYENRRPVVDFVFGDTAQAALEVMTGQDTVTIPSSPDQDLLRDDVQSAAARAVGRYASLLLQLADQPPAAEGRQ